ncbi:MAG: hypothetical protein Q9184_002165 [Pyrenodesmia sp. 2 TL-2023]
MMRPVVPIREGKFLIPATESDYKTLRKVIHKTDARRAIIFFNKNTPVPGYSGKTPAIQFRMPGTPHEILSDSGSSIANLIRRQQWFHNEAPIQPRSHGAASCKLKLPRRQKVTCQPDASIGVPGSKLPFLILEAAVQQTDESLERKTHHWVQGCHGHIKIICLLRLRSAGPETNIVLLDVIRPQKVSKPTQERPNHYEIEAKYLFKHLVIFPDTPDGLSFNITLGDMVPGGFKQSATWLSEPDISIPLSVFAAQAVQAVEVQESVSGSVSSDSDQGSVPSPPGAEEEVEHEEAEPEEDDSEGEDPSWTS